MIILSIETSCDESAISIVDAGKKKQVTFNILSNNVASQANIHAKYGGVFPMLAKREHSKNLIPLLKKTLRESNFLNPTKSEIINSKQIKNLKSKILNREPELLEQFMKEIPKMKKPPIDMIAVTHGPGLEPALWVGVNFAKALSLVWDIPVVPVNHMLGHFFSVLIPSENNLQPATYNLQPPPFPVIALLVSGGHTELILSKKWMNFKKIGETRDDAAGEAFDKVARLLDLPYPGGPEISRLALEARSQKLEASFKLPRPMIHSGDYDFSFSGLKTAVLYLIRDLQKQHSNILENVGMKSEIAREFEDAAVEVLVSKTLRAAKQYKAKTIIVAGGVAANNHLRKTFEKEIADSTIDRSIVLKTKLLFPTRELATDNSLMIALAGYFDYLKKKKFTKSFRARGNLAI